MGIPSSRTTLGRMLQKNPLPLCEAHCPSCGKPGIKAGTRATQRGNIQRIYCRTCGRHFSDSPIPRKHYSHRVILAAVTAYNLGRTLEETKRYVARHFRTVVPNNTIHSWVGQFAPICTFTRYRKRYTLTEEEVIQSRTFSHQQEYKFKFHRLKANMLCKRQFPEIRKYLWHIADHCPNDLFQNGGSRCSDGNLPELGLRLLRKDTNAVPLAQLGLLLAKNRRGRHEAVQHFMLANDSATVAVELPVYLYPNEAPDDLHLDTALTGHIDVLQIRGNRVWVLDYKPDARKETRAKYQLYLYARALGVRTGLPLSLFGLAYFDDKDYFEVTMRA